MIENNEFLTAGGSSPRAPKTNAKRRSYIMKQKYQKPLVELMLLSNEDVLTTSGFPGDEDLLLPLE